MKKVVLAILDGFGIRKNTLGNAIAQADTQNFDRLWERYPHSYLQASGEAVGLPEGQMGNSEVGHLNIGAGRVVYQEILRISKSITSGAIASNPEFIRLFDYVIANNKKLHFIGLVSDGGVHSYQDHLHGFLEFARSYGVPEVVVHAFLDGRDVPPRSAGPYLEALEETLARLHYPPIASITGRYYAMDRDNRWDRLELAYQALTEGKAFVASTAAEALQEAYERGEDDEFVRPTIMEQKEGVSFPAIGEGDGVFCFNFRSDRVRQLTRALMDPGFAHFPRKPLGLQYLCLTEYDKTMNLPVAFQPLPLANTLGEYLAAKGKRQIRIAETEKYAHVTFFFNGGVETPNHGEDRIMVPSPKVATYDLQPEMSAREVSRQVTDAIEKQKHDFILVNFANADMVGHTGIIPAAIIAVETVDRCLGDIYHAAREYGYTLIVTADHGNAEMMLDEETHGPLTAHTTNPVPFIVAAGSVKELKDGRLADIAPTVLHLMGLEQPEEMTGESLI